MEKDEQVENEIASESTATAMFVKTNVDFDRPVTLVGEHLDGRFMIEKNLTDSGADEGGIGVVYLATDLKLMGKKVVVKILREAVLKHPDVIRKFLHEKEALIRLDHPGIVRILDSGTLSDGNPFMVMEYIEGHSLRKELQTKKQLSLDVVAHLIEAITDALAAAHAKNIIHRDIKPENIMLTPQDDGFDRVRLIDFGIARVGDSQLAPATEISRAIGTVMYIAPEQLIGSLDLTPAVDIYATAIVAYELLTGVLPFNPRTVAEMFQIEKEGVKVAPSELRADLPRVAERILLSALDFEADKRPQNARAFGRYLGNELRMNSQKATDEFYASVKTEWADLPEGLSVTTPAGFPLATDETNFPTVTHISPIGSDKKPFSPIKWIAPTTIVLLLISMVVGYMYLKESPMIMGQHDPHEISYFLTVQKMRDGNPFEEPFKSSGQEVFESGYKFSMVFQADADGNIYIFNEGKDESGNVGYFLLFPTPSINNGTAQVTGGQPVETANNTFGGGKGTEIMWVIWTKQKRQDLEGLSTAAMTDGGAVKDVKDVGRLQSIIEEYKSTKRDVEKDSVNQRTVIKTEGDIIVHRFELEHR